jgi:hypothetical protein
MLAMETDGDSLEPRMGKAKFVGSPIISKAESLELRREVSAMMTSNIVKVCGIVGSKFRNATGEIKMCGIASSDRFEPEGEGVPPG